ncbi:MAG: hypothetical protein KGI33_06405 [Thaumarchaeota archaeon]|nr:hypothetical protein [Nitrososphaerota archaeon]
MIKSEYDMTLELSSEARLFAQKVARSVIEIESNVNNIADVVVLLDVLGYRNEDVKEYGFDDLFDLANHIYGFVDAYEDRERSREDYVKTFTMPIGGTTKRIAESLGMLFPFLGSLLLLFLTGASLWMVWGLPAQVSTALVVGVFLGLVVSEGMLHVFSKLFNFYLEQGNVGEIKRVLKKQYAVAGIVMSGTVGLLFAYGYFSHIPLGLVAISSISTVTISLHRLSYMVIFALKKLVHIILPYSAAFATIFVVYFMSSSLIHEATVRYFTALAVAFSILSVFAVYHNLKIVSLKPSSKISPDAPHFYKPRALTDKTLQSNFRVQFWESLPNFLFGTFYFIMMFSDRIISWSHNPIKIGDVVLPLGFNSVYHVGADVALTIMVPATIIQYVMASPLYRQINNVSVTSRVSEVENIRSLIRGNYRRVFAISISASVITAIVINLVVPQLPAYHGVASDSIQIMRIASIGNIFLTVFSANAVYVGVINKLKPLAFTVLISAIVVGAGGLVFGRYGLEYITISYVVSTAVAAALSTLYLRRTFRNFSSIFFARYV